MSDSIKQFEARLQAVITMAETLKVNTTGKPAPRIILMHYASRLAWANAYLTVAALALVSEVTGRTEPELTEEL